MAAAVDRQRWTRLRWQIPAALALMALIILAAKGLRTLPAVEDFMTRYPGETPLPAGTPVGFPAWLGWQHFLNALFLVLIVRSGWLVRTNRRPEGFWAPRRRRPGAPPKKLRLYLWLHLVVDALWLLNGLVFVVLILVTGQWARIVPTSWDVFPNAVSVALQYASLDWPTENGWINYNSLQLLAYFTVVFVAAPLAILTGIRMSLFWPQESATLNRLYPIQLARAVHFPVMLFFVAFVVVHVTLVLATGALRNLNHMYAAQDGDGWVGAIIFALSAVLMVAAWAAVRPLVIRAIAAPFGTVTR
ncbi:cytochrome b/b6 domain-containing protein [Leifsonia sp. YAF41]|uniref:cytochrome b/b6 domain-containing protein n=1 Tax=Leifsonia sp. YAF41 TaxID=3233086 RepID=UPI003F9A5D5F